MERTIWVIGGANIDVCGMTHNHLMMHDSNIGEIEVSFGGVGRNIAEMITLLGGPVHFVSCFSDDVFGQLLQEDCKKKGMKIDDSIISKQYSSSMYAAILDEEGEMIAAVNDMRILDEVSEDYLNQIIEKAHEDDIIVLDGNLSEELFEKLSNNAKAKIAADPVSVAKCKRLESALDRITIFKPNQYEAAALSGIEIHDEASAKEALNFFKEKGVKEIIISLGKDGVLFGTEEELKWIHHRKVDVHNVTGGGDALLAAYITERFNGASPNEAILFAISSAILRIEAKMDEKNNITTEMIKDNLNKSEIEETLL